MSLNKLTTYTRRDIFSLGISSCAAACALPLLGQTPRTVTPQLLRTFRDTTLRAISPDGGRLCLWSTHFPIETISVSPQGVTSVPSGRGEDTLSVVVVETGSATFSMKIESPATSGSFFAEGDHLYVYAFLIAGRTPSSSHTIVNLKHGTRTDKSGPVLPIYYALGTNRLLSLEAEKEIVVTQLPEYKVIERVSVGESPSDSWQRVTVDTVSVDRTVLIYGLDRHRVLCRSTEDLSKVLWVHHVDGRSFPTGIVAASISPNSKWVAVAAVQKNVLSDRGNTSVSVLDVSSGKIITQIPANGAEQLAISPDGSLIAVGHRSQYSTGRYPQAVKLRNGSTIARFLRAANFPSDRSQSTASDSPQMDNA